MINIEAHYFGQGRATTTEIHWFDESQSVVQRFESLARFKQSPSNQNVYISEAMQSRVHVYSKAGEHLVSFDIPIMRGYKYRGLNVCEASPTGISLLYFPSDDDVGNQWRDIEQFELLEEAPFIGKKLGIYR